MCNKVYDDDDLVIIRRSSKYYLQYDAGAHQIAMREDEISEEEVQMVMNSSEDATKVLFLLQERLIESGVKPYKSNI